MPIRPALLAALAAAPALAAPPQSPTSASGTPDALVRFAPDSAAVWIESRAHGPLLEEGLEHPAVSALLELPGVRESLDNPPEDVLLAGWSLLGADPLEVAHDLTADGVGVAFVLSRRGPRPVLVARGTSDEDAYEDALEAVTHALVNIQLAKPVSAKRCKGLGVLEAWSFTGTRRAGLARVDERTLIVAQDPADLEDALEHGRRGGIPKDMVRHLQAAAHGEADVFAWFDLDRFYESGSDLDEFSAMPWDPGAQIFLGPVLSHFGGASEASVALRLGGNAWTAELLGTGRARKGADVLFPDEERADALLQKLPSDLAYLELHRDVGALLANRTDLVGARKLPGLAEAVGNIGLLAGGPDAADALIAALEPDWTVLVHPIEFGETPTPDVPLPALTLVARLADPEKNEARFLQAFQSGAALIGADRAQKGEPNVLLGVEMMSGIPVYKATLDPPGEGAAVDLAYNLSPGCCVIDGVAVLGTHYRAVRSAAERLRGGHDHAPKPAAPGPRRGIDRVAIDGPAFTELLAQNRELLTTRAVLVEGKPRDRAEAEFDLVLALAKRIGRIELTTDGTVRPARNLSARLTVELVDR
ncbi:MAG: hypothetical protein AAFZ87_02450 [Planctomycetota bacterium]